MPLIDMGNVQDFEPMPKGTYPFKVAELEWIDAEDNASGGEYGYIRCVFEYDGEESEYQNRKQFRNLSESPKALPYMKKGLIAMGADAETVSSRFDPEELFEDLVGNPVRLRIVVSDNEGEPTNEVKGILPPAED